MRGHFIQLVSIALLAACSGNRAQQASVCIDRGEQGGRVNITPVIVQISHNPDGPTAMFELNAGGESKCADFVAGQATASLRFPYPYYGSDGPKYWQTKTVVTLLPGKNRLDLDTKQADHREPYWMLTETTPGWHETGWHDMWELKTARR
jgi:hypothetical protein